MYGGTWNSPAVTSHGCSRTGAKIAKQQSVVNHRPSDNRCENPDYNASFGRKYDPHHHEESVHRPKQQYPFDQHGYETGSGTQVKEQILNGVQSSNIQNPESSTCNHCAQNMYEPIDRVEANSLSNSNSIDSDKYCSSSQIQSSYDTSCSSFASQDDFYISDNSMAPYTNTSTYLNGIGQWVDDSTSGSTWTAWQNPGVLLEHASKFNIASVKRKPHVEEAIDCFQASFYRFGDATSEYPMVEHR